MNNRLALNIVAVCLATVAPLYAQNPAADPELGPVGRELDQLRERSSKSAPADRLRAYEQGIEEVRKSGVTERALKVGDRAPDFELANSSGKTVKLSELLKYNLQTVRAYLLREDFQRFWTYQYPSWARPFVNEWCTQTMRSKIDPMKKVARMFRGHEELIPNWFKARGTISAGVAEGLNNKLKMTTRKAYGFRTFNAVKTALYLTFRRWRRQFPGICWAG